MNDADLHPDGRPLLLLGGGGHAAVTAEAATAAGWRVLGCLDDEVADAGSLVRLGSIADLPRVLAASAGASVHAAVGDPALRRRWLEAMAALGAPAATIVHPSAVCSPSAVIEHGAFIGPRAVVNAHCRIGRGAIVNTGAIVEHDVELGPCAHVAPGAVVTGGARIGAAALVGAGAIVLPGRSIGAAARVAAGAVATRDVPAEVTVAGVPARPLTCTTSSPGTG